MKPTRPADRRRPKARFQPEMLETRALLTGGGGNTFAILTATAATSNQKVSVPFSYQPSLMTLTPKHQITLGIDVAAQSGSSVVPKIVGVEDLQTHQMLPVTRGIYAKAVQMATPGQGKQTTAVLLTLHMTAAQAKSSHNYALVVQPQGGTTGPLLVGFYLPGDVDGDGTVSATDVASVKQDQNINANSQNYVFAADANRDGVINKTDLRTTQANLGASLVITPVVSANLNSSTDSGIQDRITNIQTVIFQGTATPGAVVTYTDTNNTAPITSTTADVNGNYTLHIPIAPGDNTFNVKAVDTFVQSISGLIAPVTFSASAPAAVSSNTLPTPAPLNLTSTTTGPATTAGTTNGATTPNSQG